MGEQKKNKFFLYTIFLSIIMKLSLSRWKNKKSLMNVFLP